MANLPRGSVRPIHRADAHIIEQNYGWTSDPHCRPKIQSSQRTSPRKTNQVQGIRPEKWLQPASFRQGMIPVVLERFGRTAPGAQAIFTRIINHTILFKIITRIKFSNYLGRYSYSFRARQELISVTVIVLWV